jgi:hypothetical protein
MAAGDHKFESNQAHLSYRQMLCHIAMSFGSLELASGIIAIVKLANDIRERFIGAQKSLKEISNE